MALATNSYLRVWKINEKEKSTSLQVSASKKNKETGEYEKDFQGFMNCVGKAKEKASALKEGDSIKVLEFNVTTRSVQKDGKWTNYTNFNLFDFELPEGSNSASGDGFMNVPDGIDEELPFN